MRVALDGTPLLGTRTGIGRYVKGLVSALGALAGGPEVTLTAFTLRGDTERLRIAGVHARHRPFPARALQALWSRTSVPPVEWFSGDCDVFHATNFVLPPTRRAAGVLSIHDLSFLHHATTVTPTVLRYQTLVPRGIARAAAVLALTHTAADEIADAYGIERERVRVARPGVDGAWATARPPDAALRAALGLPERYLLFVGSVEPRKNLPVLLEALRAVRTEPGSDVPPLVLAGPAGWGPPLDTAGLPDTAVVRPGYLSDDALRSVVAGATALIYPTRHEGFGLPPLEALACGTAVISSDLPVLREVTADQATYVPVDDVAALAEAIANAIAAPASGPVADAVRAQRIAYASTWTWERCAREAYETYRFAAAQ
jgi:glycosyltransferase involved in cell wall biosynthesis